MAIKCNFRIAVQPENISVFSLLTLSLLPKSSSDYTGHDCCSRQRIGSVVRVVETSRMLLMGPHFLAVVSVAKGNGRRGRILANRSCPDTCKMPP